MITWGGGNWRRIERKPRKRNKTALIPGTFMCFFILFSHDKLSEANSAEYTYSENRGGADGPE